MRYVILSLLLLSLIGVPWDHSTEDRALGGQFPPAASRPARQGFGWLRISRPTYQQYPPIAWGSVFYDHGHVGGHHPEWYGQSMGVPTYKWGYFGVKARPYTVNQGSYHNDHAGCSYRRGY